MTNEQLGKLLKLVSKDPKRITAEAIVAAAADPKHPVNAAAKPEMKLSSEFEWDDKKAAYNNRLERARDLIQRVPIYNRVVTRGQAKVPYYVRDPYAGRTDQGYICLGSVGEASEEARLILAGELDRVISLMRRADGVSDKLKIPGVNGKIKKVLKLVTAIRKRLDHEEAPV